MQDALVACSFRITEALISLASLSSVCRSPFGSKNIYLHDECWHLRLKQHLCAEISCRMGDLFYLEHHPRSVGRGIHRVFTTCLFPGSFKMNLRLIAPFAPKHYHITLFAFRKKTQNLNALEHLSHERSL